MDAALHSLFLRLRGRETYQNLFFRAATWQRQQIVVQDADTCAAETYYGPRVKTAADVAFCQKLIIPFLKM